MKMQNIPNWKKGDIICLLGHKGGVLSIFEANQDPWYGKTFFSSKEDFARKISEHYLANN